jgi:hypothetical protein
MSYANTKYSPDADSEGSVTLTIVRRKVSHKTATRASTARQEPSAVHFRAEQIAAVRHVADRAQHFSMRIPSKPVTFSIGKQRWPIGVRYLFGAFIALCASAFLAVEINKVPDLRVQIVIVAVICGLVGLVLVHLAVQNMFAKLCIDSYGIRLTPRYAGFAIPWSDLRGWGEDGFAFRFCSPESKVGYTVGLECFSPEDAALLRRIVTACAFERRLADDDAAAA